MNNALALAKALELTKAMLESGNSSISISKDGATFLSDFIEELASRISKMPE